ncbi:MAG: Kelch repeat-containing protein [Actinomycetota bacterium]
MILQRSLATCCAIVALAMPAVGSSAGEAGTWSAAASMSTARYHPTATSLLDGRVLIVGGEGNSSLDSTAELYSASSGTWATGGTLNEPRTLHVAVRLADGRVLVAGGFYSATAELYDPATNSWTPTGSMKVGRISFTGTQLADGRVLVVGGNSFNGLQASAEIYDPKTGIWTSTGSLKIARRNHTATLLSNGSVLVAGGAGSGSKNAYPRDAELFNPKTGRWGRAGSMTTGREAPSATRLADGRVLVAGGGNPNGLAGSSAELYNPASGSWSATGSMNAPHGRTAVLLQDGRVLVADNGVGDVYSPATGTWTETGPMVFPYASAAAALLTNGRALYAGGAKVKFCGQYSCDEPVADAELYTP